MGFSPLNIPQIQQSRPIVDKEGRPAPDFVRALNEAIQSLKASYNELLALPDIQDAIADAQAAADAANTAAATANSAATSATTAVSQANAYPTGLTISATDAGASASIFISAFTEVYPQTDGSNVNVSVNSGSITGLAYSTDYWIYYDDPTRAGGAVTYHATTTQATAAQTGDRIAVGAVTTPAAAGAPVSGKFKLAPGTVEP